MGFICLWLWDFFHLFQPFALWCFVPTQGQTLRWTWGTNEVEKGEHCPLVPVWSRTDLGTAGPLPGAKRMPGTCHPKGYSSPGLKHCVDMPQFSWRSKNCSRRIWVCPSIFQRSWGVSPVKDSPLNYISSLSPGGESVGFRGEVRAPQSCEYRV